jgi:hypothetical protein
MVSLGQFSQGEMTHPYSSSGDGHRDELYVTKLTTLKLKTVGYAIWMQA